MTSWIILLTMTAGGIGAVLRFLADRFLTSHIRVSFPLATAIINFSGSAALGYLTGFASVHLATDSPWLTLLGVGLIGGYTTFSTVSIETTRLLLERRYIAVLTASLIAVCLCVAASYAGLILGRL